MNAATPQVEERAPRAPEPAVRHEPLVSLDALRGFDMFCIVCADVLVEGLRKVSDTGIIHALAVQMGHVEWAGFHFEDLIFPLFVFIVGVSLVYSLEHLVPFADLQQRRVW